MYFKTSNEPVVNAYTQLSEARLKLISVAKQFAQHYDADHVILNNTDELYFYGIKFRNPSQINFDVWRKPDNQFKTSSLRVRPLKKELQAEFDQEIARWNELKSQYFGDFPGKQYPTVSKEDFYTSIGMDGGQSFFYSIEAFFHHGNIYIRTDYPLQFEEIVASEYLDAKKHSIEVK